MVSFLRKKGRHMKEREQINTIQTERMPNSIVLTSHELETNQNTHPFREPFPRAEKETLRRHFSKELPLKPGSKKLGITEFLNLCDFKSLGTVKSMQIESSVGGLKVTLGFMGNSERISSGVKL